MLRLYGGEIFSSFVRIDESVLAKALKIDRKDVIDMLSHLDELKVLMYSPMRDKPQVTYILSRQDADQLPIDTHRLEMRRKLILSKMKKMTEFVGTDFRCRMQFIQEYFDEYTEETCGICDICISRRKADNLMAFGKLRDEVLRVMKQNDFSVEKLEKKIEPKDRELFVDVVRELVDEQDPHVPPDPPRRTSTNGVRVRRSLLRRRSF